MCATQIGRPLLPHRAGLQYLAGEPIARGIEQRLGGSNKRVWLQVLTETCLADNWPNTMRSANGSRRSAHQRRI
jgi:hypothetical protein